MNWICYHDIEFITIIFFYLLAVNEIPPVEISMVRKLCVIYIWKYREINKNK